MADEKLMSSRLRSAGVKSMPASSSELTGPLLSEYLEEARIVRRKDKPPPTEACDELALTLNVYRRMFSQEAQKMNAYFRCLDATSGRIRAAVGELAATTPVLRDSLHAATRNPLTSQETVRAHLAWLEDLESLAELVGKIDDELVPGGVIGTATAGLLEGIQGHSGDDALRADQ